MVRLVSQESYLLTALAMLQDNFVNKLKENHMIRNAYCVNRSDTKFLNKCSNMKICYQNQKIKSVLTLQLLNTKIDMVLIGARD